jgi:hypothetical protein
VQIEGEIRRKAPQLRNSEESAGKGIVKEIDPRGCGARPLVAVSTPVLTSKQA